MATVRNAPVAFRFDPEVKQALSIIAERDGRSMANMMEWLIRKHCEREGLAWPPAGSAESKTGSRGAGKPATRANAKATVSERARKKSKTV